jgi:hypothetical protein
MTYLSGRIVTYARDLQGRISNISTQPNASGTQSTIAFGVTWQPDGAKPSWPGRLFHLGQMLDNR